DLLLRGPGGLGHLRHGGGTAQLLRQLADDLPQLEVQLLQPPGNPHRPPLVPEVPLQLPGDGGGGVGGELHLPVGVEPVHPLDQSDSSSRSSRRGPSAEARMAMASSLTWNSMLIVVGSRLTARSRPHTSSMAICSSVIRSNVKSRRAARAEPAARSSATWLVRAGMVTSTESCMWPDCTDPVRMARSGMAGGAP